MKRSSIGIIERGFKSQTHERLGQYFVNRYIKNQWPELFYCEDYDVCKSIIKQWLIDNHYTFDMPPRVNDI